MFSYIANTKKEQEEMLAVIGVDSIEELFSDIKPEHSPKSFNLPKGKSEFEVVEYFRKLALKNSSELIPFIGGGYYDHYVPSVVSSLMSRGEFFTAYTPYQPECSQGTLQALYEYQSAICTMTNMEISNASLYDGGTALYEAAMMAFRITKRKKILIDGGVSPIFKKILKTYTSNLDFEFNETEVVHGTADRKKMYALLDKDTAAVIVQNPNFFGAIDDYTDIVEKAHAAGALVIESVYPISLGLLKTPGEMDVDIVTGEGQSLGLSLNFGGPYLGFMATKKKYARKMPGRIVGQTTDKNGKRCFVNTLQAREQHIRREKATSNICTNQALTALSSAIYLITMGKKGLRDVASQCLSKAHYAMERICRLDGFELLYRKPFFKEFAIKSKKDSSSVLDEIAGKKLLAGPDLSSCSEDLKNSFLVAVTEKGTKEEIDNLAEGLKNV